MTKEEAQRQEMERGHCPETRNPNYMAPVPTPSLMGNIDDCRKRFKPGEENSLDNFCPLCEWKQSNFNCYKRVQFLMSTYRDSEAKAMQGLMDQGHCIDNKTEEQKQKLKEQGLEYWCGYCMFRAYTCQYRAEWSVGGPNSQTLIGAQLDLMANGYCILPPYCEEEEVDTEASDEGTEVSEVGEASDTDESLPDGEDAPEAANVP